MAVPKSVMEYAFSQFQAFITNGSNRVSNGVSFLKYQAFTVNDIDGVLCQSLFC